MFVSVLSKVHSESDQEYPKHNDYPQLICALLYIELECTIGSIDCDKITTTSRITTTTGIEPGPCVDIEYLILDDPNRNINSGDGSTNYDSCDNLYNDGPNYDWRGHSWYRMQMPAGTKIPDFPIEPHHCGTNSPGWLNGTHPLFEGDLINATVCFNYSDNLCLWSSPIQIKHCGNFFLYNLEETPVCDLRYCSE